MLRSIRKSRPIGVFALAVSSALIPAAASEPAKDPGKHVIGATADFEEVSSGFRYTARVDTGATTCSIHAEDLVVERGSDRMTSNVGKKISFVLTGPDGKRKRVESKIADTVRVKTSDMKERRYKVWLTLRHDEVERRVHVTINDREHMEYPLLIGRNFLSGRFVVDVEREHSQLDTLAAEDPTNADGNKPRDSEG